MLDVLFIVFGLFAACLVTEVYSAAAAPLGYEDDEDLRFGTERTHAVKSNARPH